MFADVAAKMAAAEPLVVQAAPAIPGRLVHIDGDALAYKASGPDGTDAGTSRIIALNLILKAKRKTQAERAIVHMTADGSHKAHRYLIATVKPYQEQRAGSRKPANWKYLRAYLCGYTGEEFTKKVWATREADDGIAACAHYAVQQGRLDGIHADDKDMRMLPGIHYSWRDDTCLTEVRADDWCVVGKDDKVYGHRWFWLQMLHGDAADNIPGLEYTWMSVAAGKPERMLKVGPATAEKLLSGCHSQDEASAAVLAHYERGYFAQGKDFAHDRFLEQALLLWLRRDAQATLLDFLTHYPPDQALREAGQRLEARVAASVAALQELQE